MLHRRRSDLGFIVQFIRDLSQRQSDLFSAISLCLQRYEPPELQALIDDDVADAAAALAATFETASRGVIYEHRSASLPADRLATALKPIIAEAGKSGGSAFDRDAAVVLRRIEDAARRARTHETSNRRAFLDLLERVLRNPDGRPDQDAASEDQSRLIVP